MLNTNMLLDYRIRKRKVAKIRLSPLRNNQIKLKIKIELNFAKIKKNPCSGNL